MNAAVENIVPPASKPLHPAVKTPPPAKREWMKTAGWAKDDMLYAEAVRLGQEYRHSMTWDTEHAGS